MARFYLHLHNGDGFTEDREGADFANLNAAKLAAVTGLRDVIADEVRVGDVFTASDIDVCDSQQQSIEHVHFRDVVRLRD